MISVIGGKIHSDHTPWCFAWPEVDYDVMNAVDTGQVHPPSGGLMACRFSALAYRSSQFWFVSIYSIAGFKHAIPFYVWKLLISRFVKCDIYCRDEGCIISLQTYNFIFVIGHVHVNAYIFFLILFK